MGEAEENGDLFVENLVRLDAKGFKTVMHVNGEVVLEEPIVGRTVEEVTEIMSRPIDWVLVYRLSRRGSSVSSSRKIRDEASHSRISK